MIARAPHTGFAVVWLVITAQAFAVGIVGLQFSPWWSLAVGLWALAAETFAVAYKTDLRTTLSEVTTYYIRQLSKHVNPLRGWNTLVAIQAAIYGRMIYVIIVGFGGNEVAPFAAIVGILFAIGQHDHWLNPPEHG